MNNPLANMFSLSFPPEWVKAALVLSFFSTGVVIGVFAYLNRYTKKSYFSLWTSGWMFFAVWLAAAIQLEESPDSPFLVLVRRACIGACALCMYWGSFEMAGSLRRNRRELGFGMLFVIVWSYAAAYVVRDQLWITLPVSALFAGASLYTGALYFRMRRRYSGAGMLAAGFILFGIQFLFRPFVEHGSPFLLTVSYVATSVLAVFIAMGMVVQVLEQGREQN